MTKDKVLPGPCSQRQLMYIEADKLADVTLYGGAAGSGKSEIGVIDFLKYTDIPNFIGVMTRRTTPQLNGPGGLLSKAKRIFSQAYGPDEFVWRAKDGKFIFHKSKAEIYLKHFENDEADVNWQGAEANLFYVDEGTQFTQHMVQYIMSRMRNPSCPQVKPHLKITCNPSYDHFLRKWVEPYLKEDGTPDRTKDGMLRYFTFQDGDFIWADTKEELVEKYGVGYDDILSFTFISATVDDNPIVKKINPKYVAWLKGLKGVERSRLLEGNWLVRESSSGYFKKEWCESKSLLDLNIVSYCRAWDIAGSLPSDSLPNPDWTAGVLIGKTKDDRYVIVDVVRFRARFGEVMEQIIATAKSDPEGTKIILPMEPGQAGKAAGQMMIKDLIGEGFSAHMRPSNKSKVIRFQPFAAAAQAGLINYLEAPWNDTYFDELEGFDGSRRVKDDQVDATSDAFITLAQKFQIPDMSAGLASINLKLDNPFHKI
jgi:predicted phage terminase large subunit-like protein